MSLKRRFAAAALAVAVLAGGAACGDGGNTIADQAKRGDDLGYVAGDGTVQQLAPDQRRAAISLQGTTLDGTPWDLAEQRGKVVVLNVWGSWCQPCEAEAPHLETAHVKYATDDTVEFMGIDVGEGPETGAAAAERWGLTYPSLSDPERLLASSLDGLANATPSTLVVDKEGRIAARISGAVTSPATLTALIDDVAAQG
ncbi:MAG: TlpA disulfide reductase family protein [Dermatophilus congolensis]|nr:TlpA disulfide reductase family protein [Dermatophilus congolensis]